MTSLQNLFELLTRSANRFSETIALRIRDQEHWRTLSYRQLKDSAEALAAGLRHQGINPEDKVAILSENRPEWGLAFFALMRLGGIVVPIDKLLKKDEIEGILTAAKPKLLIVSKNYLPVARELFFKIPILSLDEESSERLTLSSAITEGLSQPRVQNSSPALDSTAVIIFTSGTTGGPKGVILTHGNFLANVDSFTKIFPADFFKSSFISILPLNHAYELTGGFFAPLSGGGIITYLDSIKPAKMLETMRETESEIMLTVPAVLDLFKQNILLQIDRSEEQVKKFHFAMKLADFIPFGWFRRKLFAAIHSAFGEKFRYWVSGGAPLSPETQDFFEKLGFEVLQGYGLTETSPVLAVSRLHRGRKKSVGKPLPGVEIKIAGEREGEILAKGSNIMKGYLDDPKATDEAIYDGYFHTGDLGYFDRCGNLYISGRIKNMIVTSSGKNVSPEELEEKLGILPFAKEICVLGIKNESEEKVTAVVACDEEKLEKAHTNVSEAEKIIWDEIKKINATMADYKRIHDLILWEGEFPKTTTMKVKRGELAQKLGTHPI